VAELLQRGGDRNLLFDPEPRSKTFGSSVTEPRLCMTNTIPTMRCSASMIFFDKPSNERWFSAERSVGSSLFDYADEPGSKDPLVSGELVATSEESTVLGRLG
jgi:hypothetical protein